MSSTTLRGKNHRGDKIVLREKRLTDAVSDYAWETDGELMDLDAAEALQMPFAEFLVHYAEIINHQNKRNHRFGIETLDGKYIGNCGYYNLDPISKEAEIGIMIGDREYWGKGYGSDAVATLVRHVFLDVGLEKIRLLTLNSNIRAQMCFEKCGFVSSGRMVKNKYEFVVMELYHAKPKPSSRRRNVKK
ncbi:MAG: GNAT family N-acetyltransferase [Dehalococcoidia bacterium]|nr:GNAT family N-acetyltransferase [Dehalococcoidia bacterium]